MTGSEVLDETDVDDELAEDFAPIDPTERALALLIRGKSQQVVAQELRLPLAELQARLAEAARVHGQASRSEAFALLHRSLDDITDRVHVVIDTDRTTDFPALLAVLVAVHRLRADLVLAERGRKTP